MYKFYTDVKDCVSCEIAKDLIDEIEGKDGKIPFVILHEGSYKSVEKIVMNLSMFTPVKHYIDEISEADDRYGMLRLNVPEMSCEFEVYPGQYVMIATFNIDDNEKETEYKVEVLDPGVGHEMIGMLDFDPIAVVTDIDQIIERLKGIEFVDQGDHCDDCGGCDD